MNVTAAPELIPIPWQDYLAGNYDRSAIPWNRYRYSGTGVVKVAPEAIRNARIAQRLLLALLSQEGDHAVYTNAVGVEVERSQKEERIPDVIVISAECDQMLEETQSTITLDMPNPILVVEVVSPSSKKEDTEDKPFEYMERGVGEYISIDWRKEVVAAWSHTDGNTYNYNEFRPGEMVLLKSFPDLSLSVDEVIGG